jgi:hypothetical protein
MVMRQHRQHLALRMIRSPATDAFRQRGGGESGFNTHPDL